MSVRRADFYVQQKAFIDFFSNFNNTRGVSVIYIDDIVCDEMICPIGTNQLPYYFDFNHMSWVGTRRLKDKINKTVSSY